MSKGKQSCHWYESFEDFKQNFQDALNQQNNLITTFASRLKALKSLGNEHAGNTSFWLSKSENQDVLVKISTSQKFDSQVFAEEALIDGMPKAQGPYHYIECFFNDSIDDNSRALILIIYNNGQNAELLHMQSGQKWSGSDLHGLADLLFNTLNLKNVMLADDATIHGSIPLRLTYPLTHEAYNWYNRLGFKVIACHNALLNDPSKSRLTQDEHKYYESIIQYKNASIASLIGTPDHVHFSRLLDYYKNSNTPNISIQDNKSLQVLVSSISQNCAVNQKKKTQDLKWIFNSLQKTIKKQQKNRTNDISKNALLTLYNHQVLARKQSSIQKNIKIRIGNTILADINLKQTL